MDVLDEALIDLEAKLKLELTRKGIQLPSFN